MHVELSSSHSIICKQWSHFNNAGFIQDSEGRIYSNRLELEQSKAI